MENLYKSESVQKFCIVPDNPSFKNTKIPLHSRILICGGSGSGKTNALLNYIQKSDKTFDHIMVVSSGVEEPLYQVLEEKLGKKGMITFFTLESMPTLRELVQMKQKKEEYLVIFDDVIGDLDGKHMLKKVINYFIMGRKEGLTQCFLTQSFFKTPKTIRSQLTHLLLLRLSSVRDLNIVLSDYVLGVSKPQLVEMYRAATAEQFCCLKVDINATNPNDKFGRNFTDQFMLEEQPDGTMSVTPGPWYRPKPFLHNYKRKLKPDEQLPADEGELRGRGQAEAYWQKKARGL